MKVFFERPAIPDGQSWTLFDRRLDAEIPFQWHYHREYELTLTLNSRGQRYVGDHFSPYGDGDLVLLGPNLPHTWASSGKIEEDRPHRALVIWFRPEWADRLAGGLAEFSKIAPLLKRAAQGLRFSPATGEAVRSRLAGLVRLEPPQRLLVLLGVLLTLAADGDAVPLASPSFGLPDFPQAERLRIGRVLDHIHDRYREAVSVEGLAALANLSVSGFHRMFRKHMQMTALDYIAQLRIGFACRSLVATTKPIARIAEDVGFDNLSNFNRRFRALKKMTPREFRQAFTP